MEIEENRKCVVIYEGAASMHQQRCPIEAYEIGCYKYEIEIEFEK